MKVRLEGRQVILEGDTILSAVDELLRLERKREGQDAAPNSTYWNAVDAVLEVFASGPVPVMFEAMAEAAVELSQSNQQFDETDPDNEGLPPTKFFDALGHLKIGRDKVEEQMTFPVLESVRTLVEQLGKDAYQQIARMYGFVRPNGSAEVEKVADELKRPGCHSSSIKGWMHPNYRERLGYFTDQSSTHLGSINYEPTVETLEQCPESVNELLEQGIPDAQIIEMKRRAGVVVTTEDLQAARKSLDEDAGAATEEEREAQESLVMEMHAAGKQRGEIADELALDGRTVAAIIKRRSAGKVTA